MDFSGDQEQEPYGPQTERQVPSYLQARRVENMVQGERMMQCAVEDYFTKKQVYVSTRKKQVTKYKGAGADEG